MALTESQAKVLGALFAESPRALSVPDLCGWVDVPGRTVYRAMDELVRSGLAEGTRRRWRITSSGRALFQKPIYRDYRVSGDSGH
ncbi:hypothetical protein AB4305_19875 [Nocardia sp. 2YAB30]|uniref:hypothetical protein n=1 Tax=unclassified Nocardia TaxID=2637762 RepID=UPI003F9BAFF4